MEEKNNLGTRIDERLKELGKGHQWLANEVIKLKSDTKFDVKTVGALISRKSKRTQYSALIADALGVSQRWLTDGSGEKNASTNQPKNLLNQGREKYIHQLSQEEVSIVSSYRSKPRHDQLNVLKLLDIEPEDFSQSA